MPKHRRPLTGRHVHFPQASGVFHVKQKLLPRRTVIGSRLTPGACLAAEAGPGFTRYRFRSNFRGAAQSELGFGSGSGRSSSA